MFSMVDGVLCVGLFCISQTRRLCAAGLLVGFIGMAQAQTDVSLGGWQLSAGWQDYSEAQMNLKGPELGLHWQSRRLGTYTLEADAHLGLQNYSSAASGQLDQVPNVDTRWRALRASTGQAQWQYGLALHTHANFLRGTTSLGFGGYDRLSTQVWLPVRWQSLGDQRWVIDAGWLLWGEHVSRLSQTDSTLQDVTNTQRKGAYFQISQKRHTNRGELEPYARWTWVDDSDVQMMTLAGQTRGAYEPQNHRLQLGMKWRFR
jgi:hypothetical protein